MIYTDIEDLIGNTPLLKLKQEVHGLKNIDVYAKLELMNPFGSVKDRVAKALIHPFLDDIKKNNKTIIESSSGNTAKAMAAIASKNNIPFKTITNRIKVNEVRMMLQVLETDIEELPGLSDCPDPNDPNDPITIIENLVKLNPERFHYTDQYFSKLNLQNHYETTGKEIYDDLKEIDYFAGFLGTCGSTMGAGKYFLDKGLKTDIIGVVSKPGNWIPGGRAINELYEVGFYDKNFFDSIIPGTISEGITGMLNLNRKAGILCGPTAGMTYYALIEHLKKIDPLLKQKKNAVFIACDRIESYMSYINKYRPDVFLNDNNNSNGIMSLSEDEINNADEISSEKLEIIIDDALIIDIRSSFAFDVGHIKNSFNIMDEILELLVEEKNPFPRNKDIVIVCPIGNSSKRYAAYLKKSGYSAYSLSGGIANWKNENRDLIKTIDNG